MALSGAPHVLDPSNPASATKTNPLLQLQVLEAPDGPRSQEWASPGRWQAGCTLRFETQRPGVWTLTSGLRSLCFQRGRGLWPRGPDWKPDLGGRCVLALVWSPRGWGRGGGGPGQPGLQPLQISRPRTGEPPLCCPCRLSSGLGKRPAHPAFLSPDEAPPSGHPQEGGSGPPRDRRGADQPTRCFLRGAVRPQVREGSDLGSGSMGGPPRRLPRGQHLPQGHPLPGGWSGALGKVQGGGENPRRRGVVESGQRACGWGEPRC